MKYWTITISTDDSESLGKISEKLDALWEGDDEVLSKNIIGVTHHFITDERPQINQGEFNHADLQAAWKDGFLMALEEMGHDITDELEERGVNLLDDQWTEILDVIKERRHR